MPIRVTLDQKALFFTTKRVDGLKTLLITSVSMPRLENIMEKNMMVIKAGTAQGSK